MDIDKNYTKMSTTEIKKKILEEQLHILERKDIPTTFQRDILTALREDYYQVSYAESLVHEVEVLNQMSNDWLEGF